MAKHNVWMSVSDLMTGLMIIFLFIAVSYISKSRDNEEALIDYVDSKQKLYDKLNVELKTSIQEHKDIVLDGDLSMRFTKAETSFENGAWEIKDDKFKRTLDEVMSKYFDVLLRDTLRNSIKEIRIEGHSDDVPSYNKNNPLWDSDPFIYNARLSQRRALEILLYLKKNVCAKYTGKDKAYLEYWLTASGMSYSRALDEDGNYVFETGKQIDREKSRRVEIRLITTGDEILKDFVNKNLDKKK